MIVDKNDFIRQALIFWISIKALIYFIFNTFKVILSS